jgi:hypothetical protein
MWNYCVYLGGFVGNEGSKYDLGIHINDNGSVSAAIVYGDKPGEYISGDLSKKGFNCEIFEATRNRASALGLYHLPDTAKLDKLRNESLYKEINPYKMQ